jgi:Uma2 family endonuclease
MEHESLSTTATLLELVNQRLGSADLDGLEPDLREALLALASSQSISYDAFLTRRNQATRTEWVGGVVERLDDTSAAHERTVGFLDRLVRGYVDICALGVVRGAPIQLHLANSVRSPDLVFVSKPRLDRLKDSYVLGAPNVAVEVIDSGTAARDRGAKFYEYERAGIAEYWLIDPHREWAEFSVMDRVGRYQPAVVGDAGTFRSRAIPGFWLRLEWLWESLYAVEALRELTGQSMRVYQVGQ